MSSNPSNPRSSPRRPAGEAGATTIEYGLMLAFVALVVFAAVGNLGTQLMPGFTSASTALGGS
jgi:Flp pilus assembly pilin Flp